MAIAGGVAGTWAEVTADAAITVPGSTTDGSRLFLLATWKDFSVTATVSGWSSITSFADGAVGTGNGLGSMKVAAWYFDQVSGAPGNPTLDLSAGVIGAAVIVSFTKGAGEAWRTPTTATAAASWTTSVTQLDSSSSLSFTGGELVIGLLGVRDDTATFNRNAGTGDGITAGVSWTANHVEFPATHFSTTTGNDCSADAGYRILQTAQSGSLAFSMKAALSAAETGAALWIMQGVDTVQPQGPKGRPQIPQLLAH